MDLFPAVARDIAANQAYHPSVLGTVGFQAARVNSYSNSIEMNLVTTGEESGILGLNQSYCALKMGDNYSLFSLWDYKLKTIQVEEI